MAWRASIVFLVIVFGFVNNVLAKPSDSFVNDWQGWVESKHPKIACPWALGQKKARLCYWLGELSLDISDKRLNFAFTAESFVNHTLLALPGDTTLWPAKVLVNGRPASIIERSGKPYLSLNKGKYSITGSFQWQRRPSYLAMPQSFVLLSLTNNGKNQMINRQLGKLFFDRPNSHKPATSTDALTVEVYRLLQDGLPLRLHTQLRLSVSGKAREVKMGRLLGENLEVINISAPLPLRIEDDGSMRVQVKPGIYTVDVWVRFTNNPSQLSMQKNTQAWPEYEYLSFQSNTDIRQVQLTGAPSIDTSQVSIPSQWKNFPTYRLSNDVVLDITTQERGDSAPSENSLSVNRELWLDFDGKGLTALDNINGKMSKLWRLNTHKDTLLGRAEVAGQPVLITEHDGMQGVEIRSPEIELMAVSRIQSPKTFSAIGWQADVESFNALLHLPPGWRVLFVSGAEKVSGAWVDRWDLWDIFLVLIIIAASYKLMGLKAAVLAAVSLVLAYHESGFPISLWPLLLVLVALLPVLKNRALTVFSTLSVGVTALLWVMIIAFAITSFRLAIYPSLEKSGISHQQTYSMAAAVVEEAHYDEAEMMPMSKSSIEPRKSYAMSMPRLKQKQNLYTVGEKDRIQTGPGLPVWNWSSIDIEASGAVDKSAQLNIMFSSPLFTRIWRVLNVLLLVLWAGLLTMRLYQLASFTSGLGKAQAIAALPMLILLLSVVQTSPVSANTQQYPPAYLLKELEQKLLQAPACLPHCVSQNNGRLAIINDVLTLSFDVYADAKVALPLPKANWGSATLNGKPMLLRNKQGKTFGLIEKGGHKLRLTMQLRDDQLTLSFPLAIHNFSIQSDGWQVDGMVDGRVLNNTLTLHAKAKVKTEQKNVLTPKPIKPFVIVNRQLVLDKDWQLLTTVERVAPLSGSISVNIPLVEGEKVLSNQPVSNGLITVQFQAKQRAVSWRSTLKPVEKLHWQAVDKAYMLETWQVKPSSLWRVSAEGLLPVKNTQQGGSLQPTWKPWPNEELVLNIDRPSGVKGPVQTVEDVSLTYTAGKLKQRTALQFNIRSSQGESYNVDVPDDAKVLSVTLNGKPLNLPAGNTVSVQLQPGLQFVEVAFEQSKPLSILSQTPVVQLPDGASNISLKYELPQNRWPLYVAGPAIGPAMLYWGVLCVILLAAIALSVISKRAGLAMPVTIFDWLLLGIGLSTVNSYGVIFVAAFFFLLAYRQRHIRPDSTHASRFNVLQVLIVIVTIFTVVVLVSAIPMGLLSTPNMKVVGNGSYAYLFNYYQDHAAAGAFPTAQIYSVPLLWYRVVMLIWSLWLAMRLVRWGAWWWQAFSAQALWLAIPVEAKASAKKAEEKP